MKVGGGLNYVSGPMGAGKSLYATRRIVKCVTAGRYAVTNVELLPGWAERVAFHVSPHRSKASRRQLAQRLAGYYVYETELVEAMRYRLPAGKGEARGDFLWDETHNDLNNRNWKAEGRETILEWATQLRKLGFVGFLLTQHTDNTDAALRRVCNFKVLLQNQREQTRFLGLRVTPWPLFLAVWVPTNAPLVARTKPVRVERYFLGWHRHLYDTMDLYHGLAAGGESGVIQLPAGGRSLRAALAVQAPTTASEDLDVLHAITVRSTVEDASPRTRTAPLTTTPSVKSSAEIEAQRGHRTG